MRRLSLGFLLGFLAAAGFVYAAVEVNLPRRTNRATVILDELGEALFGATPGTVAVAGGTVSVDNLPAIQDVNVISAAPAGGQREPWSISISQPTNVAGVDVFAVPGHRTLVITDIDGMYLATNGHALRSAGLTRLVWASIGPGGPLFQRSYKSGIVFGPGETVRWESLVQLPGNAVNGDITFMGYLTPTS